MGLITGLLTLPIAPVRAVVWLAECIDEQAHRELYDPESIRRQLAALEDARDAGELTEQECADMEEELVGRLLVGTSGEGHLHGAGRGEGPLDGGEGAGP